MFKNRLVGAAICALLTVTLTSPAEAAARPSAQWVLAAAVDLGCVNPPANAFQQPSIWKKVPGSDAFTYSGYGPEKGAKWGTARANYWSVKFTNSYAVVWMQSPHPRATWECNDAMASNAYVITYKQVETAAQRRKWKK